MSKQNNDNPRALLPDDMLIYAIENQDMGLFDRALGDGANVNQIDAQEITPLMKTVAQAHLHAENYDMMVSLVAAGADIKALDAQCRTAIDYAERDIIKEFLELKVTEKLLKPVTAWIENHKKDPEAQKWFFGIL